MSDRRTLLFELGSEELPPKALFRLSEALKSEIVDGLDKAGLEHGAVEVYATPRRLAVMVKELSGAQADREVERKGPALQAAFDAQGNPKPAVLGFARSCGVDPADLERVETPKGTWLVHRFQQKGQTVVEILPGLLSTALERLPIPKRMRWGALDEQFVRPVHWLVLLFGGEVVPFSIFNLTSDRTTYGHRFHAPGALSLAHADDYPTVLEAQGHVMPSFAVRRERIRDQVEARAAELGGRAVIDPALLDEVTGMNEWPLAVVGSFEERFLDVPHEALVSAMKGHQKYFHVVSNAGDLMPAFVTISNIESRNPDVVRSGNERVIRPRLADAAFFWQQDCARPLADHVDALKRVLFQKELGTLHDKSDRLVVLAAHIAEALGDDAEAARRAAVLAKCDLLSGMVGEFPELQGIMGRYYARHDGEPEAVAQALEEQYRPRFAGDDLPTSNTGRALAIADKLDTLVGIFAIGQAPTGDRDPFALRRSALGILRMMVEDKLPLDLVSLIDVAAGAYEKQGMAVANEVRETIFEFMIDRLRAYFADQGVDPDVFEAVRLCRPTVPSDFAARVHAVSSFRNLPEAAGLAQANKRIRNILRKSGETIPEQVDADLLREMAEQGLAEAMSGMEDRVKPLLDQGRYGDVLELLAGLHRPVDAYFEAVMVMADDAGLRLNRLAQLQALSNMFLQVADISALQQAG
ncbi:MAG: glycine--tRNA ligase subunit beta [Gammaproteobacteria bacterium]|nr:glycine--tRNA ligase subunit beta [Gammaproteobacteria bacterium]